MKLKYLEKKAKQIIDEAVKEKCIIYMCVDGFQTDKEALHLRDMLLYARNKGVVVHLVPLENK